MTEQQRERRLDYGAAVRRLRLERGLGLNDLAARAGVSASYLSEVERGHKRPSTDVLALLARAFGMAPSELLAYVEASSEDLPDATAGRVVPMMPAESPRGRLERMVPFLRREPAPTPEVPDPHEHSLQALARMARALPEDDLKLLLDLARRLLERRGPSR
jgi:transcriptional regulator with XRE-family HTH domain